MEPVTALRRGREENPDDSTTLSCRDRSLSVVERRLLAFRACAAVYALELVSCGGLYDMPDIVGYAIILKQIIT